MDRRGIAAVGVAALLIGAALLYQALSSQPRPNGPMPITAGVQVQYPLAFGMTSTWGNPIPELATGSGVLVDVQLLEVQNVEILGIAACEGSQLQPDGSFNQCAPINARGWPPSGVTTVPLGGVALGMDPHESPGLLIGVRRTDAALDGAIGAVRILYRADDTLFEVVQPWSLRLTEPQ